MLGLDVQELQAAMHCSTYVLLQYLCCSTKSGNRTSTQDGSKHAARL